MKPIIYAIMFFCIIEVANASFPIENTAVAGCTSYNGQGIPNMPVAVSCNNHAVKLTTDEFGCFFKIYQLWECTRGDTVIATTHNAQYYGKAEDIVFDSGTSTSYQAYPDITLQGKYLTEVHK